MTVFDYIIIAIIVISSVVSIWRGFLKEVFSLAAWVVAGFVTFTFSAQLSVLVPDAVESPTLRLAISAAVVFLLTLFTGGVINFLIHKAADRVGLTGTDRLLGLLFGIARGVFVVVILLLLAGLTPIPQESWWEASVLVDYFKPAVLWLQSMLPEDIAGHVSL